MKWCLAESRRRLNRVKILKGKSMSLHQDVARARLAIRFKVAGDDLVPFKGCLGTTNLAKSFTLSATGIYAGTKHIVRKAFEPGRSPPDNHLVHRKAGVDEDTALRAQGEEHCREITELLDADAAYDEQLALEMLVVGMPASSLTGDDAQDEYFYNNKVRSKDKAHGCRRITSRTWPTDPVSKEIASRFVLSKNALAQLIRFSDVFRERFERCTQNMDVESPTLARRCKDLASAKHRFDSHSKPFGRSCLYLPALIDTAQSILDERGKGSGEGKAAYDFLEFLATDGEERLLLLGMMSDAGNDNLAFVSCFDDEDADKSSLAAEVEHLFVNITYLFNRGGVLDTGYTYHVRQILEQPRLIHLDGCVVSIGGSRKLTDDLFAKCLLRMQAWADLAREVVAAEFPNFEALSSFDVFNLKTTVVDPDTSFAKLASLLRVGKTTQNPMLAKNGVTMGIG